MQEPHSPISMMACLPVIGSQFSIPSSCNVERRFLLIASRTSKTMFSSATVFQPVDAKIGLMGAIAASLVREGEPPCAYPSRHPALAKGGGARRGSQRRANGRHSESSQQSSTREIIPRRHSPLTSLVSMSSIGSLHTFLVGHTCLNPSKDRQFKRACPHQCQPVNRHSSTNRRCRNVTAHLPHVYDFVSSDHYSYSSLCVRHQCAGRWS